MDSANLTTLERGMESLSSQPPPPGCIPLLPWSPSKNFVFCLPCLSAVNCTIWDKCACFCTVSPRRHLWFQFVVQTKLQRHWWGKKRAWKRRQNPACFLTSVQSLCDVIMSVRMSKYQRNIITNRFLHGHLCRCLDFHSHILHVTVTQNIFLGLKAFIMTCKFISNFYSLFIASAMSWFNDGLPEHKYVLKSLFPSYMLVYASFFFFLISEHWFFSFFAFRFIGLSKDSIEYISSHS